MINRVLLCLLLLLCIAPLLASAANDLAAINGKVHDASGSPVAGALVIVIAASPIIPERVALTGTDGSFSVPNLFAGQYSVKISMPQFLPAMKQGIQLNAGGTAILTVNMQNALEDARHALDRAEDHFEQMMRLIRQAVLDKRHGIERENALVRVGSRAVTKKN